jgi:hypothetical protein
MTGLRMDSSIAFFIFAAALWAAWRRGPRVTVFLFSMGVLFTVAVYLHHATDALPLHFMRLPRCC